MGDPDFSLDEKASLAPTSVHYRLRPIKRGQFRFANSASHVISVQNISDRFSMQPLILSTDPNIPDIFAGD